MERERPLKGVSKAISPWMRGNIRFCLESEETGRLSRTEKRVSAATKPLVWGYFLRRMGDGRRETYPIE
jgi:hypothetical protein